MKKILAGFLAVLMILSLVACGGPKGEKLNMTIEKKGSQTGEMYPADVYYEPAEAITVESDYENKQLIKNTENNISIEFALHSDTTYTNNKNAAKKKRMIIRKSKSEIMTDTHILSARTLIMCLFVLMV